MNSSSRQLGQSLGVAIVGSVLAASMRGSIPAGFVRAAHAGWWILAGCGYVVLLLGLVCTTRWARRHRGQTATDLLYEPAVRRRPPGGADQAEQEHDVAAAREDPPARVRGPDEAGRDRPAHAAASHRATMATPSDWPSWRLEEFMPEAIPPGSSGTPDMTPLVIGELTMPPRSRTGRTVTIRVGVFGRAGEPGQRGTG